jgi:hypothetical protein
MLIEPFRPSARMPKNSNKRWTNSEDQRLLELAAIGKPRVMIGAALKRSSQSVAARLVVLKTMANSRLSSARRSPVSPSMDKAAPDQPAGPGLSSDRPPARLQSGDHDPESGRIETRKSGFVFSVARPTSSGTEIARKYPLTRGL